MLVSLNYCWFTNWPQYTEGKERSKKEADHSILVVSRFNKQGNSHRRLVLGGYKTGRSPQPRAKILKVHIEALTSFNHIHCADGLNKTGLSQG